MTNSFRAILKLTASIVIVASILFGLAIFVLRAPKNENGRDRDLDEARSLAVSELAKRSIFVTFSNDEHSKNGALYALVGRESVDDVDWKNLSLFPEIRGFNFVDCHSVSVSKLSDFRNVEQICFLGLNQKLTKDDWRCIFRLKRLSVFAFPYNTPESEHADFRERFPHCITQTNMKFFWVPDSRGDVVANSKEEAIE